ncbi:MAG: RidA family protein [Firmicutes bacterium]|nr:RidA family protein [Bacillota bacterium]
MERINPEGIHKPGTAYSHIVKAGKTLYIAGQIALDPAGNIVGVGNAAAQARQVYENLKACLASQGLGMDRVVKITTYVTSRDYLDAVRDQRSSYFPLGSAPASTLLVVAGLARPELLIEIDAIAVLPG